eukprot:scaffold3374_cov153-Pinguiococcus_pyrenoidosus.AAC.3
MIHNLGHRRGHDQVAYTLEALLIIPTGRHLGHANKEGLGVLKDVVVASKEIATDLEHLLDATGAIRKDTMEADEDDDAHARRIHDSCADVGRIRNVDLRSTVIQEPRAITEHERQDICDRNPWNERLGLIRVPNRHNLANATVVGDANVLPPPGQAEVPGWFLDQLASRKIVHKRALAGTRIANHNQGVLALHLLRPGFAITDAGREDVDALFRGRPEIGMLE